MTLSNRIEIFNEVHAYVYTYVLQKVHALHGKISTTHSLLDHSIWIIPPKSDHHRLE